MFGYVRYSFDLVSHSQSLEKGGVDIVLSIPSTNYYSAKKDFLKRSVRRDIAKSLVSSIHDNTRLWVYVDAVVN